MRPLSKQRRSPTRWLSATRKYLGLLFPRSRKSNFTLPKSQGCARTRKPGRLPPALSLSGLDPLLPIACRKILMRASLSQPIRSLCNIHVMVNIETAIVRMVARPRGWGAKEIMGFLDGGCRRKAISSTPDSNRCYSGTIAGHARGVPSGTDAGYKPALPKTYRRAETLGTCGEPAARHSERGM